MKTVLCVPGHDERKIRGCRKWGADLILFDLEDSVPEGMKDRARELVAANVRDGDAVRVNQVTAIEDAAPMGDRCAIWIPKHLIIGGAVLNHFYTNIAHAEDRLVFIVETPDLVCRLIDLVRMHLDCAGLAFGAADFAAYMNVPSDSPQVEYARQQVALTAAALRVPAIDSPCTRIGLRRDHPESEYNEAWRAMMLGYKWKGVVHPTQIDEVQRVGRGRTRDDRQLVDLYDEQSEAVMLQGDQLVAPPMIRAARKRLEQVNEIEENTHDE
jgi:citrate lyase subunit beta/citryl-CoA lyase